MFQSYFAFFRHPVGYLKTSTKKSIYRKFFTNKLVRPRPGPSNTAYMQCIFSRVGMQATLRFLKAFCNIGFDSQLGKKPHFEQFEWQYGKCARRMYYLKKVCFSLMVINNKTSNTTLKPIFLKRINFTIYNTYETYGTKSLLTTYVVQNQRDVSQKS